MASEVIKLQRLITFILKVIRRRQKTIVSALAVFTVSLGSLLWRQRKWNRLPPGPWGLPVVGILPHLVAADNPGRKVRNMSQYYGPMFYAKLGSYRAVFLNSPNLMKDSITQRVKSFSPDGHERRPIIEAINFTFDLPTSNLSDKNQSQRRMVYRVLHRLSTENTPTVQAAHKKFKDGCNVAIEAIHSSVVNETLVDPSILLTYTIPNVLFSIIFNICFDLGDPDYKLFLEGFCQVFQSSTSKCSLSPQADILLSFASNIAGDRTKTWKELASCVENKLNMERDEISTAVEDFLTGVEKDDRNALDSSFTMNLLLTFALRYIAEASLPTIASVSWLLLYMVKYPHMQQKVQMELDQIVGRQRSPKTDDASELPYIRAVIQESLRHSPLAYLSLQYRTGTDMKIGGYSIPSDTYVFHNLWSLLHDGKQYPVQHKYNPDRFLQNHRVFLEDERVRFLQFGRRCTQDDPPSIDESIRFLFFANILHRFNISSPINVDDISLESVNGLIRFPKPFEVRFSERD